MISRARVLREHRRKGLGEGVRVAGPACRHIIAVAHHEGRPLVIERVPGKPVGLAPIVGRVRRNVEKILRVRQGPRDLLLHRAVADRLTGRVEIPWGRHQLWTTAAEVRNRAFPGPDHVFTTASAKDRT